MPFTRESVVKELNANRSSYQNKGIIAGKYVLSIQASQYHYCNPRIDRKSMGGYAMVELALFTTNGKWVFPKKRPHFPKIVFEPGKYGVAGYIPFNTVIEYLNFLEGLP